MKRIGIAIVVDANKVLVGIRPDGTVLAGLHEFPGGKCLEGESPADCAVRECQEETGLHVHAVELLDHRVHTYEHGTVELSFLKCQPTEPVQRPQPPFEWIALRELASCEFPEANRDVVARLLQSANVPPT